MARLILKTKTSPSKITVKGEDVYICQCGLSKDVNGLCDGSHKVALNEKEGAVYQYDKELKRVRVDKTDDDDGGCCGACKE